jgi:hypothetical protein
VVRSVALVLVLVLLALLAWVALHSSGVTIVVNGRELAGPARFAAEGWGLLVGIVGMFCAAILLTFVFAGIGLILLGAFVLAGLLLVWLAFPFLLPLLIPLVIVWLFVAAVRGRKGGVSRDR